jgi:epoxyqueuosine reductase QueG
VSLFDQYGLAAANVGGYGPRLEATFSYRLAQYEAGIGVYGRFGVCLSPEFGCAYTVGVLLTDAKLPSSGRSRLEGFSPCRDCRQCADACPVRAIDPAAAPAEGYDRDLCSRFVLKMKERHGEDARICARCFSVCPWGTAKTNRLDNGTISPL